MVKLQVILLTYNHEKYIAKALNSIAQQNVNFEIEVLLSDDKSEDKTIKIIEEFRQSYSLKIRLIKNEVNKGILYSVKNLLKNVTAPYVAILDGDDSWQFSNKLQQQVDFLDDNLDYNGTFHDTRIIHENDSAKNILFQEAKRYSQLYQYNQTSYLADLIKRIIIPTSSLVSRSTFITNENLELLTNNYSIAWKLTCFSINKSKFFFFNEEWSEYINHNKGFSKNNKIQFHNSHIEFLKSVANKSDFKFHKHELYASIAHELRIILDKGEKTGWARFSRILKFSFYETLSLIYYAFRKLKSN